MGGFPEDMPEATVAMQLRDYVDRGSEAAFTAVVQRCTGLVYATALRRVGGDAHLARDVTQLVFIDLARKARSLSDEATHILFKTSPAPITLSRGAAHFVGGAWMLS